MRAAAAAAWSGMHALVVHPVQDEGGRARLVEGRERRSLPLEGGIVAYGRDPVVKGAWIAPGAHINAVGADAAAAPDGRR